MTIESTSVLFWFIPAPAGNTHTVRSGTSSPTRTVHPRACGEHRGRATLEDRSGVSVHPRACGEHRSVRRLATDRVIGSSPRLRGTLGRLLAALETAGFRFIPAPAGNTKRRRRPAAARPPTVHPRACGEHTSRKMFRRNKIFPVKERTGGFLTDGDSDEQVESAGLSTNSPCPFRRVDRARNLRASFRPGPPGSADWHHRFQRCSRCRFASPRR